MIEALIRQFQVADDKSNPYVDYEEVDGIVTSDCKTNGDVILAAFPNYKVQHSSGQFLLFYEHTEEYSGSWIKFDEEWWNAPFVGGAKNDGIVTSDCKTNGDVILAAFPNYKVQHSSGQFLLFYEHTEEYSGSWIKFDEEWWNTPFVGGAKNE